MRGRAIWAGALVVLGAMSQATLADAPLKRLTLRQDVLGWEAVGRVEMDEKGFCTGVLIAPDLVLTAAHCLFAGSDRYVQPSKVTFRAGLSDGQALAQSGVTRMVVHPRYDPDAPDRMKQIHYDAGLMQLAAPVSLSVAAPFRVDTLNANARDLSVVSYGRGRSEALSWDDKCNVLGRAQGLIAFDCDVTFGSSGAPVFHRMGNRASIVSLVSAGISGQGKEFAVGMELPGVVADLKAALRRGEGAAVSQEAPADQAQARAGIRPAPQFGARGAGGAKFVKP